MDILRKIGRGLSSTLFRLLLLVTAIVSTFVIAFHSPNTIKHSLKDSGVYNTFVSGVLDELKKGNQNNPEGTQVPIDDPAIKKAITDTFTPEFLQKSTESVLDGTYNWVSGKSNLPDFKLDLTSEKNTVAQLLAAQGVARLKTLPVCTRSQLQSIDVNNLDLFNVPCVPPGVNLDTEQQQLQQEILNNKDFLANPVVTAQNLPKDSQGKTIFDKLATVPKVYRWLAASPWIFGGLTLLTGIGMVMLNQNKRKGLRSVATVLITDSLLLLVGALTSVWLFKQAEKPNGMLGKSISGNFQQTVIKAIGSLQNSLNRIMIWFIAAYALAGIAIAIYLILTKSKTKPAAVSVEKGSAKADAPAASAAAEPLKDKPTPKRIQG